MKKMVFLCTLFLAFCLTACQDDGTDEYSYNKKLNGFRIFYDLSDAVSELRTTVPTEQGEERINSFYILFFENEEAGDGEFIHAMDVMSSYQTSVGSKGTLEVNFEGGLNDKKEYKLLLCANIEDYIKNIDGLQDLRSICVGKTENEVISTLQMNIKGNDTEANLQHISMTNIPMSSSVVKRAEDQHVSVELTRGVSRFDIFCQAAGYELVSASVWNAYIQTPIWAGATQDYNSTRTKRYYGVEANSNKQIVGSLYAFENHVSRPMQHDDNTTCLIIGLLNQNTGKPEYFRANINANNMGQKLKRNNIYRTTIRNVESAGAANEQSAYEDPVKHLDIDINGWMLDIDENVVYDDKNILALPTSSVVLSYAGDERRYNIFTNGEGTLSMTKEGIPTNVTIQLNGHELYIHAPSSTAEWNGKLHFSIGEISATMSLRQTINIENSLTLNYDVKELPEFSYKKGASSPAITVNSSGSWVAKIYGGKYMSFSSAPTQVTTLKGEPGESFNIYTIEENPNFDTRHCFAVVALEDHPEVNRAIVLSQQEKSYLTFASTEITSVAANGATITDIILESNVEWTAQFQVTGTSSPKFLEDGVQKTSISGSGNKSISIVIPANTVYKENTIVLKATATESDLEASREFKQAAKVDNSYLRINPTANVIVPSAGETYTTIKVESNYSWEATFQLISGSASPYFTENDKQVVKVTGTGNKTLNITFPPHYKTSNSTVYLYVKSTNAPTTRTATKSFTQDAYSRKSPRVISNGAGVGNLVSTSSANYTDYVYALGTYMRAPKYKGDASSVVTSSGFSFSSGITESNVHKAQIIQLVSPPSDTEFDMIYNAMQQDKMKFLMITGNLNTTVRPTIEKFEKKAKAGYGTVYEVNLSAHTARYFNSGSTKKLMKYLMDGPAGKTTSATLYGYSYSVGFPNNSYPSTFIPIIRSTVTGNVVFGIDPTHRLIFMGDPGIFGSNRNSSATPNWQNYQSATSGSSIFLHNLIAWMLSATTVEGFADKYK